MVGVAKDVMLTPVPRIQLRQPNASGDADAVNALIASLERTSEPGPGYSQYAGFTFSPAPSYVETGPFVRRQAFLPGSDTMRKLVSLGPRALPYLLTSLSNHTPTRIVCGGRRDKDGFGLFVELLWNPFNGNEDRVFSDYRLPVNARPVQGTGFPDGNVVARRVRHPGVDAAMRSPAAITNLYCSDDKNW